jgi:hypothetical protein
MKSIRAAVVAPLALSFGVLGAVAVAAPAHADSGTDAFLSSLSSAGLGNIDPATAVSVGQSVCPMLSEPGQQLADVASDVSGSIGQPLGPSTMFTGLAISMFCPGAVSSVMGGDSPIPLGLLGI